MAIYEQFFNPLRIFLRNKDLRLVEWGYITMNNAIKIENVGIFYPFSVCRGGMTFMQTIVDVPHQYSRICLRTALFHAGQVVAEFQPFTTLYVETCWT